MKNKKTYAAALVGVISTVAWMSHAIEEIREPVGNFPKDKFAKVAVIAFSPPEDAPVDVPQSTINAYKKRTADAMEDQITEAAKNGAEMVITPEFGMIGYPDIPNLPNEEDEFQNREQIKPYLESITGPTVKRFQGVAKKLGIYLLFGIAELDRGKYYNTLVVVDNKGKTIATYRKINLFEGESKFLDAGSKRVTVDTPFGKMGMMTCYDIHFPNPATDMVQKDKIKIMAFATSWVGKGGMSTFKQFAKDNKVYFLAANHTYFPDSGVIDPTGKIQSHIQQSDGPAYGYLPRK